jgi:regulator of protease activity HflC (stomatin/prohibitin superfamily)
VIFRRKKKIHIEDVEVQQIPLPVLIRQVIYDSMLMPAEEIAHAMGLPPISDDVAEMEERASQERLERFSTLIPFIDSHADIAAKIAAAAYKIEDDEADGEEKFEVGDLDNLTKLFRLVALSSTLSCVSTLINLGLIESMAVSDDSD